MENYHFTQSDIEQNAENMLEPLGLDDDKINSQIGMLYAWNETQATSNAFSTHDFSFYNDSFKSQSFIVPKRTYNLKDVTL